jgi:hypothetical protein
LAILKGLPKKKDESTQNASQTLAILKGLPKKKTKKAALASSLFISIMKYLS